MSEPIPKVSSLDNLLLRFGPDDARKADAQLWKLLSPREPRALPKVPVIAYRVRGWDDISWTASGVEGYRTVLPGLIKEKNLDARPWSPGSRSMFLSRPYCS